MFAGPLPRELKPPGDCVPARRPRGRASPRASLNPERRVPARAPQAPACPRTRALFSADTPRFAELSRSLCHPARRAVASRRTASLAASLAAPFPRAAPLPSPRRPARRTAPPLGHALVAAALLHVPLAAAALLHVPLVGIAFLHAQGPHSAQYRRVNGTGVQKRRGNDASVQYRRSNATTGRPPTHMSHWRNGRHKNCAPTWAVRSPLDSRQVLSTSPLLPCTRRTEEIWAQNGTSR